MQQQQTILGKTTESFYIISHGSELRAQRKHLSYDTDNP
jgi:hypothetical protein